MLGTVKKLFDNIGGWIYERVDDVVPLTNKGPKAII